MKVIRVESENGTHEAWIGSRCIASTRDFAHSSLRDVWTTATDRFQSLESPVRIYRRRVHQADSGVRVLSHVVGRR